jgi:hypothetical protein
METQLRLNLSKKIAAAAVAATMVAAGAGSALAFHADASASSEVSLGTMLDLSSSLELTTALGETLATALDVVGELASTVHGTLDMLSVEDVVAALVEQGLDVALFTADQLAEIVELVLGLVGDLLRLQLEGGAVGGGDEDAVVGQLGAVGHAPVGGRRRPGGQGDGRTGEDEGDEGGTGHGGLGGRAGRKMGGLSGNGLASANQHVISSPSVGAR